VQELAFAEEMLLASKLSERAGAHPQRQRLGAPTIFSFSGLKE
jgi:hypothetical protein